MPSYRVFRKILYEGEPTFVADHALVNRYLLVRHIVVLEILHDKIDERANLVQLVEGNVTSLGLGGRVIPHY